jgi:hypothetical protein
MTTRTPFLLLRVSAAAAAALFIAFVVGHVLTHAVRDLALVIGGAL